MNNCYCGSAAGYAQCCKPLHQGQAASSPEALMRSRYSAFVLANADYLLKSWHPSTRPTELELNLEDVWCGLKVLNSEQLTASGKVHFQAVFKEQVDKKAAQFFIIDENSNFVLEAGHWFYVDGLPVVTQLKPQRNDICPCNTGLKFKKCCGK